MTATVGVAVPAIRDTAGSTTSGPGLRPYRLGGQPRQGIPERTGHTARDAPTSGRDALLHARPNTAAPKKRETSAPAFVLTMRIAQPNAATGMNHQRATSTAGTSTVGITRGEN